MTELFDVTIPNEPMGGAAFGFFGGRASGVRHQCSISLGSEKSFSRD
jgi:hypothetical protein